MDVEWNKPSYIAIIVLNSMIFNLSNHRAPEYTSVREATQQNNIYFTRLKVTALTNNKRVLLTKSITLLWIRTRQLTPI
jgi:hypothetical protein